MTECEEKFFKFKYEMDKKTFVYDERQSCEDEFEEDCSGCRRRVGANRLCLDNQSESASREPSGTDGDQWPTDYRPNDCQGHTDDGFKSNRRDEEAYRKVKKRTES